MKQANIMGEKMKKNYDFSKAEKGKFFEKNIKIKLPIYLDSRNQSFIVEAARKKKTDPNSLVNQLIKSDIELLRTIR